MWAAGHEGGRRFGGRDIQILQAIATQLSIAIETAKIFSEMSRCANEDALTGLANRRALDERLSDCKDGGERATLLMGDLDGLKVVNDQHGHLPVTHCFARSPTSSALRLRPCPTPSWPAWAATSSAS